MSGGLHAGVASRGDQVRLGEEATVVALQFAAMPSEDHFVLESTQGFVVVRVLTDTRLDPCLLGRLQVTQQEPRHHPLAPNVDHGILFT
jgi:hypothetical protein